MDGGVRREGNVRVARRPNTLAVPSHRAAGARRADVLMAASARRAALEGLLDRWDWPWSPEVSNHMDRLLLAEEGGQR